MSERQAAGTQGTDEARVELLHTATVDQFREALRAHAKVSPAARRQRWTVIVAALVIAASGVRLRPGGGTVHPLWPLTAAVFLFLVFVVSPRLRARQAHQVSAAKGGGGRRIAVDGTGVSVETAHTFTRFAWPAMSRYVETRTLFVLLTADKSESCLVFLPKQSADGVDESARLRGLLGAHLTRG
ncbi:hypothetical protein [Streptomyces sp. NBC_00996]|uniref:hypothetical protein n=1 Tax=Streptomyces sp. NBC_00996 TaxID=2903710 RepID=UPI00386E1C1C|nr:hypothetical protein OG390_31075 [Streptomyces sp. NBC_00996]